MLQRLKTALDATGFLFSHYGWTRTARATTGDFGVYAETGAEDLLANGEHIESALVLSLDYFTHNDSDLPRKTIEAALSSLGAAWSLISIGYDEDTGYIHYNWSVSLYGETAD